MCQNFAKFATTTSAHGFAYTVEGPSLRRVVSIVIVVAFVAVAGNFTYFAIRFLEEYVKLTKTDVSSDYLSGPGFNSEYKLVYSTNEDAQPLGVFALCDVAPWDFAKAKQANISAQMVLIL